MIMTDDFELVTAIAQELGWRLEQVGLTPFEQTFQDNLWRQACDIVDMLYEKGLIAW